MDASSRGVPALSVVIVSYRCYEFLAECIRSLGQDARAPDLEIIVVENASNDGTTERIRAEFPEVRLIENSANVGFPAGSNQGLRASRGGSILLLNPDTLIVGDALSQLVTFLEQHRGPAIAGLDVRNADGSAQLCAHSSIPTAAEFVLEQTGIGRIVGGGYSRKWESVQSLESGEKPVGWVAGSALAFTRDVVDRIGGFAEDLFWAEDLDFCVRAQNAGIPIYFLSGARVIHYVGQSGKRNFRRMVYHQHVSRIAFARVHYGWPASLMLRAVTVLVLPAKMGVRLLQLVDRERRRERRERLAAYWDVLRYCLLFHPEQREQL